MSQDRRRVRNTMAVGRTATQYGEYGAMPFANGIDGLVWFDYDIESDILDRIDPGYGTYGAVNRVDHVKQQACVMSGGQKFLYKKGNNPYDRDLELNVTYRGSIRYQPPISYYPSPNWGGLVDELAATLAGRSKRACMLAITLKEIGSTVRMFRNPFSLVKPSWRKVANNHSARTLARKGANVWLEYQYGWKSFYNDITSLSQACGKSIVDVMNNDTDVPELSRFSATQAGTEALSPVFGGYSHSASDWGRVLADPREYCWYGSYKILPHISYKYRVFCQADGATMEGASLTRKLLSNFDVASWQSIRDTLWEAVPYSFVVDWLVDMRGIWAPLNYAYISHLASGYIGYSTKYSWSYTAEYMPCRKWVTWNYDDRNRWFPTPLFGYDPNYMIASPIASEAPGIGTRFYRTSGFPPSQNWSTPLTSRGLSLSQLASGLSLIAQRIL